MGEQRVVLLISSGSEWKAVKEILHPLEVRSTPLGETFDFQQVTCFHGGWGKISASATTQYAIDQFHPDLLVNLGTCGGFEGRIERGVIILVTRTIIYDILEQMTDPQAAIAHFATDLDLSWLPDPLPHPVIPTLLVSADRDIVPAEIPRLVTEYGAVAADWESGAIAWVAKQNGVRCLILRGVTDLVSPQGGEAYGNIDLYRQNTRAVMKELFDQLPDWLALSKTDVD